MGAGRQEDIDRVAGPDLAGSEHDRHDAGLTDEASVGIAIEHRRHQARLKPVELPARIAQARHLDEGLRSEPKAAADRQA